jgi:type II secretory pathway pseudopilin PulG
MSYDAGARQHRADGGYRPRRRRGLIIVESLGALIIMGVLAGVLLYSGVEYLRFRNDAVLERALRLAAAGQIERVRAGADPASRPPPGTVAPDIAIETRCEPGTGAWEGCVLVTVTATGESLGGRCNEVTLAAYTREAQP